jgi:hypothetical protein
VNQPRPVALYAAANKFVAPLSNGTESGGGIFPIASCVRKSELSRSTTKPVGITAAPIGQALLTTYAGRALVDLRTWYPAGGKLAPGKGFAAEARHLPRLTAAFAKAEAKARELGLITTDDDGGAQ